MSENISRNLSWLAGQRETRGPGWRVESTDANGDPFTTSVAYRTRADAEDYADELRRKGRKARVIRA